MDAMVIGSGGREHALAWKLAASPAVERVFCVPGNPGMEDVATCVDWDIGDLEGMARWARRQGISLAVAGPEGPLAAGIREVFAGCGVPLFGPDRAGARLEGSKSFARETMARYRIPGPGFWRFEEFGRARDLIRRQGRPLVVKADGLAAGKGVVVPASVEETEAAAREMLEEDRFGAAGRTIVLEEILEGPEVSALAFCDGTRAVPMVWCQDHKRAGDGDTGPNTGGMGAYSPPPWVTPVLEEAVQQTVFDPLVRGMAREGTPYQGVLYAGLMLTGSGPRVLEFNVRFGDPETQVLMLRLAGDLAEILEHCLAGTLGSARVVWDPRPACGVVLASGGYPGAVETGREIRGLDGVPGDVRVFHAGVARRAGRLVTAGGRVLTVCARGDTLRQARETAYRGADAIRFEGRMLRRDIGWQGLAAEDSARDAPAGPGQARGHQNRRNQ